MHRLIFGWSPPTRMAGKLACSYRVPRLNGLLEEHGEQESGT